MVTFNPSSVTVEVPAFYIMVNGKTGSIDVANYSTLDIIAYDIPGHSVQLVYSTSKPATGTSYNDISESNSVASNGQYSDSYNVEHHNYATMAIWVGARDLTDNVSSNFVQVNVAKPVITTVDWWLYTEVLNIETKQAGYEASSNTYEIGTPAGANNVGVRGRVLDTKGNGINGVTVTITGFATSPVTEKSHTPLLGSPGYFDTSAQTIPKNNGTSFVKHNISVSV